LLILSLDKLDKHVGRLNAAPASQCIDLKRICGALIWFAMAKALHSRSGGVAFSRRLGVPRRYAFRIVAGILLELTLLLVLIEGVFLAEKLGGIVETAVTSKMGFREISLMLLATAPEIFGLALPSALLVAVYLTMLRLREDSELLIMAGSGIGVNSLLGLLIALALPAQLLSMIVTGYIDPLSRFFQREIVFDSAYGGLRNGTAVGEFHFADDTTALARPSGVHGQERYLFLHQNLDSRTDRLIIAKRSSLVEEQPGWFTLRLQDFAVYDFYSATALSSPETAPLNAENVEMDAFRIGKYEQDLALEHLIYFAGRDSSSERTLPELIAAKFSADVARRVFRSFLCLFAPLIALLAVALTGKTYRAAALPVAIIVLMSIDIAARSLIDRFVPGDPIAASAVLVIVALLIMTAFWRAIVARQDGLLKAVPA
jgi:lipopolysaccharide export system permease protein